MTTISITFTASSHAALVEHIAAFLTGAGAADAPASAGRSTGGRVTASAAADKAAPTAAEKKAAAAAKAKADKEAAAAAETAAAAEVIDYETQVKPLFVKLAAMPNGKVRIATIIDSFGVKKASDVEAGKMGELKAAIETELKVDVQSADEDEDNF